jgi:class 3 adenylate cyclase
MAAAGDSQVLTTAVTRTLAGDASYRFEDVGDHALKGFAEPVRLFSVERS